MDNSHRFARALLSVATDPDAADRLVDAASRTDVSEVAPFKMPVSPSLDTAARAHKLPARWAAELAAGVDPQAPHSAEIAELFASDPRRTVRRALAARPGLPIAVCDTLVDSAAGDDGVVDAVLINQDYTPVDVLRWLCSESAESLWLSAAARARFTEVLLTDVDATARFVCTAPHPDWAAAVLTTSASGQHRAHLVDVLDAAGGAIDPEQDGRRVRLTVEALCSEGLASTLDARSVKWLATQSRAALDGDSAALTGLRDPELIRAWWHSGIPDAPEALTARRSIAHPVLAATLAEIPEVADSPHNASVTAVRILGGGALYAPFNDERAAPWVDTLGVALDLVEAHSGRIEQDLFHEALGAISETLGALRERSEPRMGSLFERLAALDPASVGPIIVRHATPPESLAGRVATAPAAFGVTARMLANAVGDPSYHSVREPWRELPDLWAELVCNTDGVIDQISQDCVNRPRLTEPVFAMLHAALGDSTEGWDAALHLSKDWTGTVVELAAVAASFAAADVA